MPLSPELIPSDADLIERLTITEDQFTERKGQKDRGGWIRTIVAFANSAPMGYPAVLFVGVNDDGSIQSGLKVDDTMKSLSATIAESAWPPIYILPRTLSHSGLECIAVLVPGSELRPHFAGRSYVRVGTETKDASEAQFKELVASHLSKARMLLGWKGRRVRVIDMRPEISQMYSEGQRQGYEHTVVDCNAHFVTISAKHSTSVASSFDAYPLHRMTLAWMSLRRC